MTWKKAWFLLSPRERRNAWITLGIMIVGAFSSAVMVGSVMPFLAVLSDPSRIQSVHSLTWAYEFFGFSSDYAFLIALGLVSFGIIVLSSIIQITKTWAVARFALMRNYSISRRLLGKYLSQSYAFFLNRHSGEMGPRVLSESGQVVKQFFRPAAELIASLLTVLSILALLIWVDAVVAIVAMSVLGGVYAGVFFLSRSMLSKLGVIRVQANREMFRFASEALTGIKDIKLLCREDVYLQRFARPSLRMARSQTIVAVVSSVPPFALQAVAMGGIITLCLLLVDRDRLASGGALGSILPTLGVFAFAGQRLMPELAKLYASLAQIQVGSAAVDTVYEDFALQGETLAPPAEGSRGLGLNVSLRLDDISFRYPGAGHSGVSDISLEIRAGEKIGIVGSTGAGKTTLADITLGLLQPEKGRLVVDDTIIGPDTLRAWLQTVGYVPQDIFLVDASVSENIALGVPAGSIDHDKVRQAARIAQIDTFVTEELPEGYQTAIGERGVRLSGGQRQRIGIARAMYHNADLIVFDEATSALDNLTEHEVMSAIEALPGEKTVLIIAHRLSTVRNCDRIMVMEKGRIVGFDRWEILMEKNDTLRRIAQVEGGV